MKCKRASSQQNSAHSISVIKNIDLILPRFLKLISLLFCNSSFSVSCSSSSYYFSTTHKGNTIFIFSIQRFPFQTLNNSRYCLLRVCFSNPTNRLHILIIKCWSRAGFVHIDQVFFQIERVGIILLFKTSKWHDLPLKYFLFLQ